MHHPSQECGDVAGDDMANFAGNIKIRRSWILHSSSLVQESSSFDSIMENNLEEVGSIVTENADRRQLRTDNPETNAVHGEIIWKEPI